jgi:hypothetical protein
MLRRPIFFFSSGISSTLISELSAIATAYQGSVVLEKEDATHVVCWDEEVDGSAPEDLAEDFIRPIELRPNEGQGVALVHWWYYPDSYDEWIPSSEVECRDVPEDPEDAPGAPSAKQWKVCCKFVRDVVQFNEWGNELDYEKESEDAADKGEPDAGEVSASGGRKSGRGKRKPTDKQRRIETPILEAVQVTEKMMSYLPPPTEDPHLRDQVVIVDVGEKGVLKVTTGTEEGQQEEDADRMEETSGDAPSKKRKGMEPSTDPSSDTHVDEDEERLLKRKKLLLLGGDSSQQGSVQLQDFPSWYSPSGISTVELRYLPELLAPCLLSQEAAEGSRHRGPDWVAEQDSTASLTVMTNRKYLTTRNFIVDLYRENPEFYLSATECRQKIAGDAGYIIRVHEFLDAFEIINNCPTIKATSRPLKTAAFYTSCPTTRQIETHCSAFRSSTASKAQRSSASSSTGAAEWSVAFDSILLKAISSCLTATQACKEEGSGSGSGRSTNIDWKEVSRLVTEAATDAPSPPSSSGAPSPQACFRRFVEMSLSDPLSSSSPSQVPVEAAMSLDTGYVHKMTTGGGWNGTALSKKLYSAAAVVASECASHLDYDTAMQAVAAANAVIKVNTQPVHAC